MTPVVESWTAKRRALLADELGTIQKVDESLKIALAFPNSYFIGMSNLGFHTAYQAFNQHSHTKAERVFYEKNTRPCTLETNRTLRAFHAIGFTVSFELDYDHILEMLDCSKIARLNTQRQERDPLIFAGGFVTFFNYKPLIPIMDFIVVGEAEEVFSPLAEILLRFAEGECEKQETLQALSRCAGVFVPEYNNKVTTQYVEDLNKYETVSRIVTPHTEFKNMYLIELARGCFHSCKFCVSGNVYAKTRVRDVSQIIKSIAHGQEITNRFGFIASAPSDYPAIDTLLEFLEEQEVFFSFSSLRVTSITKVLLEKLAKSGQRTLTLAPESGSERLRFAIGKDIPDETFMRVVLWAKAVGYKNVKLYMMIGLPEETENDILLLTHFVRDVAKMLPVRVSITPFIPKPRTPFAQYSIDSKAALKKKVSTIRKKCSRTSRIRIQCDSLIQAAKQALYAKGDEELLVG